MNAFSEDALPFPFALGASGGPERRVEVTALGSGREQRNTPWAHGRRRYDIGGAVRTLDELHLLAVFFEARRGKLQGFRFRDPFDHKSCAPSATITPFDQILGVGDGARRVFQLQKLYGGGEDVYARPIAKPVAGSVRIGVDGIESAGATFAVDETSGAVTLAYAPAAGATVTAGFAFDTPVRFDIDHLNLAMDGFGAGRALSIPLVEVLV